MRTLTRDQIKAAIKRGVKVTWHNASHEVRIDSTGELYIVCLLNGYTTGIKDDELVHCLLVA